METPPSPPSPRDSEAGVWGDKMPPWFPPWVCAGPPHQSRGALVRRGYLRVATSTEVVRELKSTRTSVCVARRRSGGWSSLACLGVGS